MDTTPLDIRQLPAPGGTSFALAFLRPPRATRALLLLTAIAGVDDYIAQRAAHLAAEGYAVAVLDYYAGSGLRPDLSTPERIGQAVAALDDAAVLRDIEAAQRWLQGEGFDHAAIGMIGFCIGGAFALLAAASAAPPACGVAYYGQLRSPGKACDPIAAAARVKSPLMLHVGERDRLISAQDVADFRTAARDSTAAIEVHTYPGAPHAFDEWHRSAAFRPVASAEAWQRTLIFLDWHLKQTARRQA